MYIFFGRRGVMNNSPYFSTCSEAAAAIPAVGAKPLLGQTDGCDKIVKPLIHQGVHAQRRGYLIDHQCVFFGVGIKVFLNVLLLSLKLYDGLARRKLKG